jgi:hypothetical protein
MINKEIVKEALKKIARNKKILVESVVYPEKLKERMHPTIETELVERKHSLGKHEIFPEDDESTFEEKIIGERFNEVVKQYKRAYDTDIIDNNKVISEMEPLLHETIKLESSHKKELEKLAEKMIREEFDMDETIVEIHAELTENITLKGRKKNSKPTIVEIDFEHYDEIKQAKNEVYKRRFLNTLIEGAAKKCNHMYHNIDDELIELDPRLPNKYNKLISSSDYMYYILPTMDNTIKGGMVSVQFPTESNPKAVIHAQGMIFPVLIHELVKGVMELISAHGLPKNKKIGEYVISKADFSEAEPWDTRLGPGLWSRFTNMFDPSDLNLKHHVYSDLISLPTDEFNSCMKEIMANTIKGKKIIKELCENIKKEMNEKEISDNQSESYKFNELF